MNPTLTLNHNAPIVVDSFAGGGGASLGITLALGMSPHIAINHDYAAIEMHAMNHPETWHYTEDVGMRMLRPRELLNAQFTPELAAGYKLTGSTANQVAKIGNSVCPVMSQVLVEANIPKHEMQAA